MIGAPHLLLQSVCHDETFDNKRDHRATDGLKDARAVLSHLGKNGQIFEKTLRGHIKPVADCLDNHSAHIFVVRNIGQNYSSMTGLCNRTLVQEQLESALGLGVGRHRLWELLCKLGQGVQGIGG